MAKIDMEQIKADREAGTQGPWLINNYNCTADASDVVYAKKEGRAISVGDTLWSVPHSIGPINIDNNHWAGDHLTVSEIDARRIARVPELEDTLIEAVELLESLRVAVEDSSCALDVDEFLERFK